MISKNSILVATAAALVLLSGCSKSSDQTENTDTQTQSGRQPSSSPSQAQSTQADGMSKEKLDALLKQQMKPLISQEDRDALFAEQMSQTVGTTSSSSTNGR